MKKKNESENSEENTLYKTLDVSNEASNPRQRQNQNQNRGRNQRQNHSNPVQRQNQTASQRDRQNRNQRERNISTPRISSRRPNAPDIISTRNEQINQSGTTSQNSRSGGNYHLATPSQNMPQNQAPINIAPPSQALPWQHINPLVQPTATQTAIETNPMIPFLVSMIHQMSHPPGLLNRNHYPQ